MKVFIFLQITIVVLGCALNAQAARLKDVANIRGVRGNQLIGYGIVVGLEGTGGGGSQYTNKSVKRMLSRLGMKAKGEEVATSNVAAVIVTAELPPFARSGNKIDVTVNALGEASSLKGGTLVQTPLRAANEQTYAVAQGPILTGHNNEDGVHPTVGRIPDGAIIEKDVGKKFSNREMFRLTLHNPDFTTAARVAKTINKELAGKYASALDAATIDVVVPGSYEGKGVELLATIESIEVNPDTKAKVVVNEKTGTVVIGHGVKISDVAISHGDLTVKVKGENNEEKAQEEKRVIAIEDSARVGEIVKAMNRLGVTPKDLITILQNIKAAGALEGELEVL